MLRTGAHPNMKFKQLIVAPYIGDGSPVDQTMWVDNLTVGTGRITPSVPTVASVTVAPASASVTVGGTYAFTTTLKDATGAVLTGQAVTWTSRNTGVAPVSDSGVASGISAGSTPITATSGSVSGSATLAVNAPLPLGTVSDLSVTGVTDTSVTLSFTEVPDGTGKPASYDGRYATGSLSWGSAAAVVRGTCATPVAGTAIGAKRTCTVLGLTKATSYQFQMVAFRGTLNVNAVFGSLSNVASGTTASGSPPPVVQAPGTVTNLAVAGVTDTSVTLSFTEVTDGAGQPASYDSRSAAGSMSWGSAANVPRGTCAAPVAGTAIGANRTCTVLGLTKATSYQFQMVAFRGTLNVNAVFGGLSNVASGTTDSGSPPPVVQAPGTVTNLAVAGGGGPARAPPFSPGPHRRRPPAPPHPPPPR